MISLFSFSVKSQLTAPFTESFNSTTFPSTWNQSAVTGGPWVVTGTLDYGGSGILDHTGTSGSTRAWMDFSSTDSAVVMESDTIDVSALSNPELNFWFNNDLTGYTLSPYNLLYVEVLDTGNNWVGLDTLQQDNVGVWSEHYYLLSPYILPGNKVVVRFRAESGGNTNDYYQDLAIDDISVREYSPCRNPISLGANSITATSAELVWNAASTDTGWSVEWGLSGFTLGTGTYSDNSIDSLNISPLSPATVYSFYVRGYCTSGDTSIWAGPYSFMTLCTSDTIPYLMDFTTWPPACWDLTGGTNNWISSAAGAGIAEANFWGISSGDLWMTSLPIHINAHARVKFDWSHLFSTTYLGDSLRVEIKIDTSSTWVEIWGKGDSRLESNDGAGNTSPGSFKTEVINLDSATYVGQNVLVRVIAISGYGPNLYLDNVIIEEIPSCPEPTLLSHYALFSDSVALKWVNGLADSIWQIQYGTTGFALGTGTTIVDNNDSIAFGGLTPSTSYDVYLKSICKIGDSSVWVGPYTFVTPCSFYTPPYLEDFSTYTFSTNPTCWEEAKGQLTVASTLVYGTSNWGDRASFANNGSGNIAAVMNIYSTNRFEWLISPSIDLGTGSIPYQVEFDVAITDYFNAAAPSAGGLMGPDDKLVLVISTDNGTTWSDTNILEIWDTSNMPSFTGDYFYYNLTANGYTGKVRFGLYAETTISNEDNDAFIDNFAVVQVPTCPRPQKLVADSTSLTNAYLSWTKGLNDSTWIFEYGPVGFTKGTGTIATSTTNPATITGLMSSTCYEVYLRSFCNVADTSLWIGPARFCTKCAPVVDLCEDFEAASSGSLPICWSSFINSTGSSVVETKTFGSYSGTNAVQLYSGSAGSGTTLMLISPEMTAVTAMTHRANFWMNGDDTAVIVGTMSDPTNPGTFTPWDTIDNVTSSYQNYRINFDTYTGTDKYIAFLYLPTNTYNDITIDEFCFEAIPSCEKAPSVAVLNDGIDSNYINLGWNIDTAFHHVKYMITYGPTGYVPGDGSVIDTAYATTNFVSIAGLTPLTNYCFWVKAICANGDTSYWSGPHCGSTGCASSTPMTYFEDFTTYVPQCWEEMQGVLDSSNTVFTSITTSNWVADQFGNTGTDMAARMNIYATGRDEWLISPSINLGSTVHRHIRVEFDVAFTDYANTTQGVFGYDDTLALVISRDNGVTWNKAGIIALFDTGNVPSNTGDHIVIDLPNETGVVKFGFYAASSVSNEDNDIFVDNFKVYDSVFTDVEEISLEAQFKVFPNPSNGLFTVLNEGNSLKSNLKIVDVQGRLVYEESNYFGRNGRKLINLSKLNAGVYILLIQSEGKQEQHRLIME